MKLKEWNALDEDTRKKIATVMFALEGDEKIGQMSKIWRHNIDEDHRRLMKGVIVKDGGYTIKVSI